MEKKFLLLRLAVLVAAMICALGASAAEAYANYTPSNTTLKFYYDDLRSSRSGKTYSLNTGSNLPGWYSDGTNASVTRVDFDYSFNDVRPTTTYSWFNGMKNLETIPSIVYLNTSEVTNMAYMFAECSKLTRLSLLSFNTAKVTHMTGMFQECSGLTSVNLTSFNTANVVDMSHMFYHCTNLNLISVSYEWSTAAVTNSELMFTGCSNLVGGQGTTYNALHVDKAYAHIDGGPSNPGYLTDPSVAVPYAYYNSSNTTLTFFYDNQRSSRPGTTYFLNTGSEFPDWYNDGTSANVTRVIFNNSFGSVRPVTTSRWFYGMENLQSVTGISFLNTNTVTNMSYMFYNCFKLADFDPSHFNTSSVTNMSHMFYGCYALTSLDLTHFHTSNVTNMESMFSRCIHLQTIYASAGWTTARVTESDDMFAYCTSLVGGQGTTYGDSNPKDKTYAHIDGGSSNPGYFTGSNSVMPYACYTPGNGTLTFYYDDQLGAHSGTTYALNTGTEFPGWSNDGTNANVSRVVINPSFATARPTSTCFWFYQMPNLTTITGLNYLNTSEVTAMISMFYGDGKLTDLDLSNFNTSKVTVMTAMFLECSSLTSIDLSSFNTSNVTVMNSMFEGCTNLSSLDLSNFNTSKATLMNSLFKRCSSLTRLDLSNFDTHNATNMSSMFSSCNNLETIYVGSMWSTNGVTTSDNMFSGCTNLVGDQGTTWNPSNPTDKTYAHLDGGPSNPGYFSARREAYACYTSSNTTLTFYHDTQRSSRSGKTYDLNAGTATPGWKADGSNASVTRVVFDSSFAGARPTSTYSWFENMSNLTEISGIANLNTSDVTNMGNMFNFCSSLTSLDLSGFNTSKVTSMRTMFNNCRSLTSLDLSSFNTSNVTDMSNMFSYCTSLSNVNLSSFNTAKMTSMFCMFTDCTSLQALDLSSFNTARVTNMNSMFDNCRNLVTIMAGSGWTTASVSVSEDMFLLCRSLVGGHGTTYDGSHVDKEWARIDGGYSNPGYLTSKGDAYAVLSTDGKTLTFYCDGKRLLHSETTYSALSAPNNEWESVAENITNVVFDASFAAARPTNTEYWFADMEHLTSITGMEFFNTSDVKYMNMMFSNCYALQNIDLSHFDTGKVTEMQEMFIDCRSLTTLNLSSFNTSKVKYMNSMFSGCTSLRTIFVSDGWTTASTTTTGCGGMFWNCTSLVGGMGTTYDPDYIGEDAAHIDEGDENPGYLTDVCFLTDPYALLSADGKTLTFYHDGQRYLRTNKTYSLNYPDGEEPYWYQDEDHYDITRVVFHSSFAAARPTKTTAWFLEMENLESITGIQYLNTSEVTDMSDMFNDCCTLTSLDVSHFDTQKVTNMSGMFYGCSELTSLDVSGFDTRNVTNMRDMFGVSVTSLDVSGFDTRKVTNMHGMFSGCASVTSLDVSGFDTHNVTNMSNMFYDCESLTSLDLTCFNTDKVTNMGSMFSYCYNLASIDMSSLNTAQVENMDGMFQFCRGLTSLDLTHFNTSKVTSMSGMFQGCSKLTSLDLSSFNTSKVTNMNSMFYGSTNLRTIYVGSGWSTGAVTTSHYMFRTCTSLVGGKGTTYNDNNPQDKTYAHIDGGTSNPGYFTAAAEAYACYTPSNTTLTFYYDTERSSRTGTTYSIYEGMVDPEWYEEGISYDVTKVVFDPSFANARPTSTENWFAEMQNLTLIEGIQYLNISEVTTMRGMFWECTNLPTVDVSGFDTRKVTNMNWMFSECYELDGLDVSGWNTANVTTMSGLFDGCESLTSLDVSNWNTAKVTDMYGLFGSCSMTTLDLGNFDTHLVTNMNYMFNYCNNLRTIYVGDGWSTAGAESDTYDMFYQCINLVGGMGTTYDANHIDGAYAHIDGGPSNPGYFTEKNAGLRGDVNGDGKVTITDMTALIDYLLDGGTPPASADCNQSGGVTIADVTVLIDYLLSGAW